METFTIEIIILVALCGYSIKIELSMEVGKEREPYVVS